MILVNTLLTQGLKIIGKEKLCLTHWLKFHYY